MVDQASETLFLQDNLLSEDDWGGSINFADLNNLTPSDQSSPSDDFYLGEEGRYEEEYAGGLKNLGGNLSSPDNLSPLLSPPEYDCNFVDELLQDLLQSKKEENVSDDVLLQQSSLGQLEARRFSTHTSSSSAYSSCSDSGTPSPAEQFSDHGSCSSGDFQDQNTLTIDLTTVSDTDMCPGSSGYSDTQICVEQPQKQNPCDIKSSRYKRTASLSNDLLKASELEKAVRQACEETNRLLRLHKKLSGKAEAELTEQNRSDKMQAQDLLKNLCEETILTTPTSLTNGVISEEKSSFPLKKPQKRRASTLQDAIDRLHSANKNLCLNQSGSNQPTPFSRSALVNNPAKSKYSEKTAQMDPKMKDSCIIMTPPQPTTTQNTSFGNVLLNGTQTYTLTPTASSAGQPVQFYIKQEPPHVQSCHVVGNIYQQQTMQNMVPVCNPKVIVSNGASPNLTLSGPSVSIVKPEQLLCNNGQTILIQQPPQQSVMKPVNISNMKPGTEPMVLSQSDLTRLSAQGVIKFPVSRKMERCLMPVTDESKTQMKNDAKVVATVPKTPAIFPSVCDMLPNDAAGIINGTSVFVNGFDNQPQRGELDIKALKRHQRMIKNRASACESRQRRKEYLKTLEDQVNEVAEENKMLREKNNFLLSRVHELEIQNKNLRDALGVKQSQQKKTACVLMIMLFVGFNCFQTGLFGADTNPFKPMDGSLESSYQNAGHSSSVLPNPIHAGRHLLSVNEEDNENATESDPGTSLDDKSLIVADKQNFWMDDLVQQYKDKHLQNFLQVFGETTSNSVKRMLRRKLKEELGISIPLPVPRSRRIAYTPQLNRQRMARMSKGLKPHGEKADTIPSVTPKVEKSKVKVPTSLPHPCEQPSLDESTLNETETSRVNEDLTQWAKRYTVDRQEEAQKSAEKHKPTNKKLRNTKSPSSRYEDHENTTSTNEIALYTRPNKKYNDFLEAINRRNDTLYVFTLNKDHILLPATERNISSRMKMALVMPAVTSKDHSSHVDYEMMIQIECEVLNTKMFELKRTDVPDFLDITPVKGTTKTLDIASNDTMPQPVKSNRSQRASDGKQWQGGHITDDTEKVEDEQDAVVAVVSDAIEQEFQIIPPT